MRAGYEITEWTMGKYGQMLPAPDVEVETWWTNLGKTYREIIGPYHAHGECGQFHSEIKTDMDPERLPSGKFGNNALILELGLMAYNILRMIGQGTIGGRALRQKKEVRRRRIRTMTSNLIMMSSHITTHARRLIMELGKINVWYHIFSDYCQTCTYPFFNLYEFLLLFTAYAAHSNGICAFQIVCGEAQMLQKICRLSIMTGIWPVNT